MQEIEILHKPFTEEPYVVIVKPQGLPSAPLSEEDRNNAFSKTAELFPELLNVQGIKEIEHGLLHRLDTETEGLLLVSSSQEFYDYMQNEQKEGRFIKTYKAVSDINPYNAREKGGFPDERPLKKIISSYFRNYGKGLKEVRPVTENSGMAAMKKCKSRTLYETEYSILSKENNTAEILCHIKKGYRHQVRCHLAWAGFPVKGDNLYNSEYEEGTKLQFKATKIEFRNMFTGTEVIYSMPETK